MDTEVIQGLCRESLECIKSFSAYNIFGQAHTADTKILDRLMYLLPWEPWHLVYLSHAGF